MDLVNNTEVIDSKLAAYNAQMGWNGTQPEEGGGPNSGEASGCACSVDERGAAGALWMLVFGLGLGVARRRRE